MIYPLWLAILWLGAAGATQASATENAIELSSKNVLGAFILECETGQVCESVAKVVEEWGGTIRHMFKSDVFTGISVQLPKLTTEEDRRFLVSRFKGIKESWPVQEVIQVPGSTAKDGPEDKQEGPNEKEGEIGKKSVAPPKTDMRHYRLIRRARNDHIDIPWSHLTTHVDRLHEEGYTGSGISIAIVDSGVDYRHPALGRCFGPGCKVVTGENFSNQGDRSDPMDCRGHGTGVAGVVAGYDKAQGFVGVAPDATIMAYRVLDCQGRGTEDDMIAGWLKAKQDGAQIIVSASGVQGENWAQRPLAMVVARIVASGVPCVGGLGNNGGEGLFYAMNPSTGHGVTSVNSFYRTSVALEQRGEYLIGNSSEPVDFAFAPGHLQDDWDRELRPVHDVDADFGDEPDDDLTGARAVPDDIMLWGKKLETNCKLSPGNSSTGFAQDLVGHIALIRQTPETNNCHFYERVQNALARGAEHVLAWQKDPAFVMIQDEEQSGRPVKAVGITGADTGRAIARALASGKLVTARKAGLVRIETGLIDQISAYGPTWELDIKPTIGAPGDDISVTDHGGRYSLASGTSYAAPLVAGVFALMSQIRGTFDPALLNSLIMSTAEPQNKNGRPITVAQQGGGLLRAWEAAHATTLVEPGALKFNDTDNRPGSIGLGITNTAKTEVTYQLFNLAATTLYTFGRGSIRAGAGEAVDATADIKLSQTSITIGAGQSNTVDISAFDPNGLDPKRLPLWSGWVSIQGTDGTNLTVPYLGLGGSLRSAAVIDPASDLSSLSGNRGRPNKDAIRSRAISTSIDLVLGSPLVRVDIVPLDMCSTSTPINTTSIGTRGLAGLARGASVTALNQSRTCVPDSIVTEFGGVRSIGQLLGYPKHHVKRGIYDLDWTGAFAPKLYAPPGRYQIVARALSIMGNASNETHWQTVKSPVFSILYEDNVNVSQANQQPSEENSWNPWQTVEPPGFSILYEDNVNLTQANQQPHEENSGEPEQTEELDAFWKNYLAEPSELSQPNSDAEDTHAVENNSER
ncbi:hypothetical protein MY4038_009780 [Beauveria bassiana]